MMPSRPAARAARLATVLCTLLLVLAAPAAGAADDPVAAAPDWDDARLLRMPDIHGDTIVFVYAGDLWTVPRTGGRAVRLTGSVGYLAQPKFSPDGATIAFTGNYDGNDDVYTVPAAGGEPARLTWHPDYDRVIDWQPDGASVRFQSARQTRTGRDRQLYTVAREGGLPERIVLPTGGLSSWSPDGTKLAYNRISRELRTWKRYKGGMAQDVWIYDFAANDTRRLTDWEGTDNFPMWHGDTIYFTSDRTGRLQIWAHDLATGEQRQVTFHEEYDVKHPSLGPDAIVYENGGWLYVLDLAGERTSRVTVSLRSDNTAARPGLRKVADLIGGADLAPDAKRAVFDARGDVFTVPAEKGDVRNLTATPGIRERDPVWSPDGARVAYLSDREGEYRLYVRPADGSGGEKRLTGEGEAWPYGMQWSPDSDKLLMSDAAMNLWLVDAGDGGLTRIDRGISDDIRQYDWSHDGSWVAYAKSGENGFRSIWLYDVAKGETHQVTSDFTDDTAPCFDDEGNYLFFASARHFNPTLGGYDLKPIWADMDGLYLMTLRDDVPNPFPPESDEVAVKDGDGDEEDGDEDGKDGKKDRKKKDDTPLVVQVEGMADRMAALDVEPGGYGNLQFAGGKLFYTSRPFTPGGGRGNGRATASIKVFDLEEREEKTVLSPASGFTLAADGQKLLYAQQGKYGVIDAKPDQKPAEKPLRTDEMTARVDPRAEWRQMFEDAWRQERDFFYDPGMHGVDWEHMYERYGQLIPYVSHGADFSYVVGEMISELNASHSYVRPGDMPRPERIATGLLGCDFGLDEDTDRYVLARVLTERDWNGGTETPLHGPGLEVEAGEYLLAVDGEELKAPTNPYSLFEGKVGKQVVLEIGPRADGEDSRTVTVVPVGNDRDLRYEAWVQGNRRRVDELSDGKIGYLHLPNTAVGGQQGFAKGYYPNLRKQGLIIDERFNGGGFIPDFFMNILRQKLVNLWKPRYGQDWRTPGTAFLGHLAMVSNGYAGSGGDALPYYFKFYELGPVIGTRTWGGLVGISRRITLMDGGSVTFPEFGLFNVQGEWDVEGRGVEPTIPVDNLPHEVIAGRDPQLEKAVEVLLEKIEEQPVEVPAVGSFPRDKD